MLLSSPNWDLLLLFLVTGNGGIIEVVGGGWGVVKKSRRVGGGGDVTLEVGRFITLYTLEEESLVPLSSSNWDLLLLLDMNTDAEEPVVTMNLRDFSCSLASVGG